MPIYSYTCTSCNNVIEKRQSFSDPPLATCEQCGGTLRKIIHPVGIVFKGSGWYVTDSRSSGSGSTPGSATGSETAKPAKTDDGSSSESNNNGKSTATDSSNSSASSSGSKDTASTPSTTSTTSSATSDPN